MPMEPNENKKGAFWKELLKYAVMAIVIVIPIRTWIAQPFIVNGSSMDTTFKDGEYLIVDEISYRFKAPERGDVLIFKYPNDPSKYFIKRLIGLPGETVTVTNDSVTVNGVTINEPYLHSQTYGNNTWRLSDDQYFVMGDNRIVSSDSRVWGPLPKEDLIGRPIVRLLPLTRLGILPGTVASSTIISK